MYSSIRAFKHSWRRRAFYTMHNVTHINARRREIQRMCRLSLRASVSGLSDFFFFFLHEFLVLPLWLHVLMFSCDNRAVVDIGYRCARKRTNHCRCDSGKRQSNCRKNAIDKNARWNFSAMFVAKAAFFFCPSFASSRADKMLMPLCDVTFILATRNCTQRAHVFTSGVSIFHQRN